MESVSKSYDDLDKEIKQVNGLLEKLEKDCKDQTESNKKLEEKIAIKQRTVNLINDAPMNILKLKE